MVLGPPTGPETHPQFLDIDERVPGPYTITAIGTGNGPYTIIASTVDEDGVVLDTQTVTGMATPGVRSTAVAITVPDDTVVVPPAPFAGDIRTGQ